MRVSFGVSNAKELKSFFSNDVDFLDVIVTTNWVYVISNTPELYSHYTFEVTSREDLDGVENFRVNRKNFLAQLSDGVVTLYRGQYGSMQMSFKTTSGSNYSMEFPAQSSDLSSIEAKMTLQRNQDDFVPLNLFSIANYIRMLRDMGGVVNVIDGMVVANKGGIQLYCKTKCEDINMTVMSASYLLKFAKRIYGYQNYVLGMGDYFFIVARQIRSSVQSDYDIMENRGYSHSFKLNFRPICDLAARANISDTLVIDFEGRKSFVTDGQNKYITGFKLSDEDVRSVNGSKELSVDDFFSMDDGASVGLVSRHNIPAIEVPIDLLTDLISGPYKEQVEVKIKKTVIEFCLNKNVTIFVGRSDYAA